MTIICNFCNRIFSSFSSRCNHINKFHKSSVSSEVNTSATEEVKTGCLGKHLGNHKVSIENNYKCRTCSKNFKHKQSRWRHEKVCGGSSKNTNTDITKIDYLIKENNEIKMRNEQMQKQMNEMKELLQKALKIHPKTLQKINKQLNNTNNGTINNNIQIIQLGKENLGQVLTENEKLKILNRQGMSVNELVELIHTSDKYNQFKNILITNLQSSFCYKYDDKMKSFIAVNKDELLNDVLEARIYDINTFYDELHHLLNPKKAETLEKFLDKMDDTESKIRDIKKEEIKLILYNNRNKIKDSQKFIEM